MPEAAEVEIVRRALAGLVGSTMIGVSVVDAAVDIDEERLVGRMVSQIRRHGKRLALELDGGGALFVHLRMTGSLRLLGKSNQTKATRAPDARVVIDFGDRQLVYSDRRRLGTFEVRANCNLAEGYGVDLLNASAEALRSAAHSCATRKRGVKSLMLDQHGPVAGAGNYLIDETLFAERVHPMTSADSLDSVQWLALWHRCRAIALRSLAGRSELLEDYLAPDGARGDQADRLVCYGRAGRRCVICGSQLTRIRVARRGTTFCPSCQQENTKS